MSNRDVPEPSSNRWLNAIVVQHAIMADSSDVTPPKCPMCSSGDSIECDAYTNSGKIKYFCHTCNEQFTDEDPKLTVWRKVPFQVFRNAMKKID